MGTWNSRGLRGSLLEELINRSNEVYRTQGLALVQKIPTPITPVEMSKNHRCITLAYFEKQSTVDYIGVVQGIPVCFDAKECASDTFPLANIHEHQFAFMRAFEQQRGISFLLISFTAREEHYLLPYEELSYYAARMAAGGRKSFTYAEMNRQFRIREMSTVPLHYLEALDQYLQMREDRERTES